MKKPAQAGSMGFGSGHSQALRYYCAILSALQSQLNLGVEKCCRQSTMSSLLYRYLNYDTDWYLQNLSCKQYTRLIIILAVKLHLVRANAVSCRNAPFSHAADWPSSHPT
jgi:hypothetical protein